MSKRFNGSAAVKWGILLMILLPVLSCTTVGQIFNSATPTPTPRPLAERDLRDIALQKSELPGSGFVEVDVPDLEEIFAQFNEGETSGILDNAATGFMNYFTSGTGGAVYMNMILVYESSGDATTAYTSYIDVSEQDGNEVDIPQIGDVSIGINMSESGTYGYSVVWRYHEAVSMILYMGQDDIGIGAVVALAQVVQTRMQTG